MSKKIVVQFSDGEIFFGDFFFYSGKMIDIKKYNDESNRTEAYRVYDFYYDICKFMQILSNNDILYIKPKDGLFFYTKSSIVKISEIEEDEIKSIIRNSKLDQILK
jgi:hypothetical protein